MEAKLKQHIDEFGGKNGSLLYFREYVAGGADRVLPLEILAPGENFSWSTRRKVWAACKDFDTDKVIIRASERSDWAGMVDTMPTMIAEQSWLGVRKVVDEIRRKCHDPRILEYARREGNGYDPDRVTISVAPYLSPEKHPRTLVTQHPNRKDARMVDVSTPYELQQNYFRHLSFDFDRRGRLSYRYQGAGMQPYAEDGLKLSRWIEDADQLPSSQAFQFEGAVFQGKISPGPKLFQIRQFAEKRFANFALDGGKGESKLMRNFGVTPPEGIQLKVVRAKNRGQFAAFEAAHPEVPYLLSLKNTSDNLTFGDQPLSMKGYFPDCKPALSHQATRLVQIALRDPHGVASLVDTNAEDRFQQMTEVRVISDGIHQKFERV